MSIIKTLKQLVLLLAFGVTSVNLYALYEDKDGYSYVTRFADLYIGASIGNTSSSSWGTPVVYGYSGLFFPQKSLSASSVGLNVGFRMFQNTPVIRNLRFEGEILYHYVKTTTMYNSQSIKPDFDKDSLAPYGSEVLKTAGALNVYYDLRMFSDVIYPYIGAGMGYGTLVISSFDINQQPNGLGEQYSGRKNTQFNQLMVGLQYDTKIIKSSVYLQYKMLVAGSKMTVNPKNDGINLVVTPKDNAGAECPIEGNGAECPDLRYPTTASRSILYLNHSISFGFRYYLY